MRSLLGLLLAAGRCNRRRMRRRRLTADGDFEKLQVPGRGRAGKPAAEAPAAEAPPETPPGDAPSSKSPLTEAKPKKLTPPKVAGNPGDGARSDQVDAGLGRPFAGATPGQHRSEMRESVSKILLARTQLAMRLLAAQASERTKLGAIEAFIEANLALQEIGDANAMQRVKEFATLAAGLAEPGVASAGRHMLHEIAVVNCIMAKGRRLRRS